MSKELRMFGITHRSFSGRQQGIQGWHAGMRYAREFGSTKLFKEWVDDHETIILLEAPTDSAIEEAGKRLEAIGVKVASFREPDINGCLSGIVFIADEEMYDHQTYPIEDMRGKKAQRIFEFRSIKRPFPLASS